MSTRCQVRVEPWNGKADEGGHPDRFTLYHHCDGYPEHMMPTIEAAFEKAAGGPANWASGRPGKVAGYLCWADPGEFEPEQGHALHPDIEYFYRVRVKTGTWEILTYKTGSGFNGDETPETIRQVDVKVLKA